MLCSINATLIYKYERKGEGPHVLSEDLHGVT